MWGQCMLSSAKDPLIMMGKGSRIRGLEESDKKGKSTQGSHKAFRISLNRPGGRTNIYLCHQ